METRIKPLIISFTYPPNSGIGGRRWSKFVKEFDKLKVNYEVVAAIDKNVHIEKPNQKVHFLPSGYPYIIAKGPRTILERLLYRVVLKLLKARITGNYFDRSVFWHESLIPFLKIKLTDGFTHVIASGGPFYYMKEILQLKSQFPKIQFIADFRDPWVNNKTSFGYAELTGRRLEFEARTEQEVIDGFDKVVSVAQPMTDYFKSITTMASKNKFLTLPNGFDLDDKTSFPESFFKNGMTNVVFTGSLYDKLYPKVEMLIQALRQKTNSSIQIHFFGEMNLNLRKLLTGVQGVWLHGKVPQKVAMHALDSADVALLMLTDDLTYSFSTKFCEYLMYGKPIWVISAEGLTSEFVVNNRIGFHSLPNKTSICDTLDNLDQLKNGFQSNQSIQDDFNIENIARNYIELMTR